MEPKVSQYIKLKLPWSKNQKIIAEDCICFIGGQWPVEWHSRVSAGSIVVGYIYDNDLHDKVVNIVSIFAGGIKIWWYGGQ